MLVISLVIYMSYIYTSWEARDRVTFMGTMKQQIYITRWYQPAEVMLWLAKNHKKNDFTRPGELT